MRRGGTARVAIAALTTAALGLAGCGGGVDWSTRNGAPGPPAAPLTAGVGTTFDDPQGTYTLTIDPTWTEHSGAIVAEIEAWSVGPASNGFTPNVNVLTQSAPGVDLTEYLAISVRNGPRLMSDFQLVHSQVLTGSAGQPLAEMEYTAGASGRVVHFLGVVALRNGRAIVATLTTTDTSFAAIRARVEPFLLTLQAR